MIVSLVAPQATTVGAVMPGRMREPGRPACAFTSIGTTWLNTSACPDTIISTAVRGFSTGTGNMVAWVIIPFSLASCALRTGTTMRVPGRSTSPMDLIGDSAGTRNVV